MLPDEAVLHLSIRAELVCYFVIGEKNGVLLEKIMVRMLGEKIHTLTAQKRVTRVQKTSFLAQIIGLI